MKYYDYKSHNPQAVTTNDLFIRFPYKLRRTIYRMPYKTRFTKEETRDYIFEEFIRQVLLDIIDNDTIFVFNDLSKFAITVQKEEVSGEEFEKLYKEGRFNLDYLKSNFMGHFIRVYYDNMRLDRKRYKNVFLSGDLKARRDKASEI